MRALVVASIVVAVLATPALAGAGRSGVYGTIVRGPVTPVCRVGTPCSKPAAHARLVFWHGGSRVGSAVTGDRGGYRIALAPGRYTVTLAASPSIGGLKPAAVLVASRRYVRLDLMIDTGIR